MSPLLYWRLSLMMLLQYAVWGAWLPVISDYLQAAPEKGGLGFTGGQVGTILGLGGSIGAMFAPFIAGQFADRYFSTERCLAVFILLGGIIKWITSTQTDYTAWLWLSIAYSIVYMPTLALTNSLAFTHLTDRGRQFPYVRVWGTIGWIAASWAFPWIYLQTDLKWQSMPPFLAGTPVADVTKHLVDALRFSAMLAGGYALFCLFLPHTPPKRDAVEKFAFVKAFGLFRKRSFTVLVLVSLPIAAIHQIYFMETLTYFSSKVGLDKSQSSQAMTIGQFAEFLVLPFLGFLLKKLGFRWVVVIGALAYFARYAIFGTTTLPAWVIVGSQVFHGVCYACCFAAAYIYVDRIAPADVRHSAQTLIGILILGGGPVLGGELFGYLKNTLTVDKVMDYTKFWYTLAGIGLIAAVVLALFFRDETAPAKTAGETA